MWKKDGERDAGDIQPGPTKPKSPTPPDRPARPGGAPHERATIGRSITIRGDVTGDEDLVIQGRIEGSIQLAQHSVTIGPEGRVKADIAGRSVTVEGEVNGDLRGQEQVVLRSSARVEGDITSPRVVLEDGASFRGNIDMAATPEKTTAAQPEPRPVAPRDGREAKGPAPPTPATAT
jgi:cytoskeletal protein CcmA (bactofilin family)